MAKSSKAVKSRRKAGKKAGKVAGKKPGRKAKKAAKRKSARKKPAARKAKKAAKKKKAGRKAAKKAPGKAKKVAGKKAPAKKAGKAAKSAGKRAAGRKTGRSPAARRASPSTTSGSPQVSPQVRIAKREGSGAAGSSGASSSVVRAGIDLGSRRTVVAASRNGDPIQILGDVLQTVVGYPKEGALPGLPPDGARVLFCDQALRNREHVDLTWPLDDGFIVDVDACRKFAAHVGAVVDPTGLETVWGVVSVPVDATPDQRDSVRRTMRAALERMVIVPEPYLAALGVHRDERFADGCPENHSVVVDIGAETTAVCLVRGAFPTAEDQLRVDRAGDFIDEEVLLAANQRYPHLRLTRELVRDLKEEQASVSARRVTGEPPELGDASELMDLAEVIVGACEHLLSHVADGVVDLLGRADSESADEAVRHIILTGGGSRIRGIGSRLEEMLKGKGYDRASAFVPADYQRLVARGALQYAESLDDDDWDEQGDTAAAASSPAAVNSGPCDPMAAFGAQAEGVLSDLFPADS